MSTTNELPTYDEVIYQKQNEANGNNPSITAPTHYLTLPPIINLSEVFPFIPFHFHSINKS
jgi:hypothetical protein